MSIISILSPALKKRLLYAHIAIFSMLAFGTIGFHYIEGLSWSESIYFTTATVTTVGYGDIVPKTQTGKFFTTFFILLGVGTFLYALSILAQAVIHAEVLSALGLHRKTKEMEKLTDHYIICGAGRVGRRIVSNLQKENISFVIIEKNEEKIGLIDFGENEFALKGDATLEKHLIQAGVERAKGLATCLPEDASNLYTVLTARDLNKDLHIVSRAVQEQAEPKLIQAGANRVVSPIIIGSLGISRALTKPAIADFMDTIVAENLDLVFDEILIKDNSKFTGKTLKDTDISSKLNILVVAIRHKNGEMTYNPSANTEIKQGDMLVVVGKAESVQKLLKSQ